MNSNQSESTGTTTIIRRIQEDGSEESWERFVKRYEHVVVLYALSAGLREDQAEDVRQTVLMELTQLLPDLVIDHSRGSFRSLLRTIVKRRSMDILRQIYREHDRLQKYVRPPAVEDDGEWDAAWREGLMKQALREVAQRISPDTFQAFELTSMHGVPARQAAKLLGMSVDSVYQSRKRVTDAANLEYNRLVTESDSPPG